MAPKSKLVDMGRAESQSPTQKQKVQGLSDEELRTAVRKMIADNLRCMSATELDVLRDENGKTCRERLA